MRWISRKILLRFIQIAFMATLMFWYTANLWIERKLPFIEAAIGEALGCPVTIEKTHYDPFRGFLMAGVEVKQYSPQLLGCRIRRVWAYPEFRIYPEPAIWIRKVTMDRPEVRLQSKAEALFKLGDALQKIPIHKNKIGLLTIGLKLKGFKINQGRLSLASSDAGDAWRQDFEGVNFFFGERWFKKNVMDLGGHIAGKPQANFRIRLDGQGPSRGGGMHSDLRLDFHEFTTAYISPYLRDLFRLPEKNLTASVRINVQEGHKIQIRGKILMPELSAKNTRWDDLIRRPDEMRIFLDGSWDNGTGVFDRVKLKVGGFEFGGSAEIQTARSHEHYQLSVASDQIPLSKLQPWVAPLTAESGFVWMNIDLRGDSQTFRPRFDISFKNCALRLENADLKISNLGGSLEWASSCITAKNLWAFVNDMPLAVDGELTMRQQKAFKIRVSSYPGQMDPLKKINPLIFSAEAKGILMKGGWSGVVKGDIPARKTMPAKILSLSFHRLTLADGGLWKCRAVRWNYGDLRTQDIARGSVVNRISLFLKSDGTGMDAELINAAWCRGHLTGKGRLDLKSMAWDVQARLKGAQMSRVLHAFHYEYPLSGVLFLDAAAGSGDGAGRSARLKFRLSDGNAGPGASLDEWAAQTGIDALTRIKFKTFSGEMLYDGGMWDMRDLELDAEQIHLSAQLKAKKNRITGDMRIRFPASMVNATSGLKWLMDFVNADDWLDFDFRVSSNYRTTRVEWKGGRFRQQIESKLAPWMRAELERQVLKKLDNHPVKTQSERNFT